MMDEDLLVLINDVKWRKTTYIQPHEYFMRKDYPELFIIIKTKVDEDGYWRYFKGVRYRYWDFHGYRYWYFQILVNREKNKPDPVHKTIKDFFEGSNVTILSQKGVTH